LEQRLMISFTVTAQPVVEPFTYTASTSGITSFSGTTDDTQGGEDYYYTQERSTSGSASTSAITGGNGDIFQTIQNAESTFFAQTTIFDTEAPDIAELSTTRTGISTFINSWNGQLLNSDITSVKSQTTDYTSNTGYATETYERSIYTEAGAGTLSTSAITGKTITTSTNTSGESEVTILASTTTTTQSYGKTFNNDFITTEATTSASTTRPPITMWQTSTVIALRVSYTVPFQTGQSTVVSTRYGGHTRTASFTSQVGGNIESSFPITDTTGATGSRGTHTVYIIPAKETLWVPTATGVREASNLCQSFVGPQVITLSAPFSTRSGLVVDGESSFEVTQETQTLTRTITTATLSVSTTLGFGSNTFTAQGNFKTSSASVDGIYAFGNPTFWANPWPFRGAASIYRQIPAELTQNFTTSEAITTTITEESIINIYGNTPTDSAVAWKSVYFNTQTPQSTWQSTFSSFVTESYTRRYQTSIDGSTTESDEQSTDTGGSTGETTLASANGWTWVEHRPLWVNPASSNALSASITYEALGQAPLNNLTQRAKKVSIANTTITAWRPAAAQWPIDFVHAVFPQTLKTENTDVSRTTIGSFWADGYHQTIRDTESFTTFSGAWVAQGTPDTSWLQVGGFGRTGKNERGDSWTRIRPPNILLQVNSSGSRTPVTHQSLSTYAATGTEEYQSALNVVVNATGGTRRFLEQFA
jgi:hypothetical protein